VFQDSGPYPDLLEKSSAAARSDPRLRSSGKLTGFRLEGIEWGLQPTTAFYDWLYLNALRQASHLGDFLMDYDGFTDIEFNPERSLNCQAASAALYVALRRREVQDTAMQTPEAFLTYLRA
jgi:hypothetical protein